MAKELFITQLFSQDMLAAGEALIARLDHADAEVQAAFWLLEGDEDQLWKLIIISPLVESEGPRNYYKRINDINESADPEEAVISLHNIYVSNTHNHIFKAMLSITDTVLWKEGAWLNKRLGKNYIGGVYFEDMYIYRMDSELFVGKQTRVTTDSISSFLNQ